MKDVPPAYILRPTARWAYCTGIFRCACVMAMTPPMTKIINMISTTPVPKKLCVASVVPPCVENMSIAPCTALGSRASVLLREEALRNFDHGRDVQGDCQQKCSEDKSGIVEGPSQASSVDIE